MVRLRLISFTFHWLSRCLSFRGQWRCISELTGERFSVHLSVFWTDSCWLITVHHFIPDWNISIIEWVAVKYGTSIRWGFSDFSSVGHLILWFLTSSINDIPVSLSCSSCCSLISVRTYKSNTGFCIWQYILSQRRYCGWRLLF